MDPTQVFGLLTAANFATVGGGVAFVWVFLKLLRSSLTLLAWQTQLAQVLLAVCWGALSLAFYTVGTVQERLSAVILNVIMVIAVQTLGYEFFKNVTNGLGLTTIGLGSRPDPAPPVAPPETTAPFATIATPATIEPPAPEPSVTGATQTGFAIENPKGQSVNLQV